MTLTRKAPLKRTPLERKPRRRKVSEEGAAYMAWVREQACVFDWMSALECDGPVEAHHHGRKGMGQKPSDFACVPLCACHHREWHGLGTIAGLARHKADAFIAGTGWRLLVEWLEAEHG